jgi:heme oxygenase
MIVTQAISSSSLDLEMRSTPISLRQALREATSDAHERLHLHAGFAAIQNGTIELAQYRALLFRLYGFYQPFEAAMAIAAERSTWLQDDLAAVTVSGDTLATIPRCSAFPRFDTPASKLGALYVVEGSTLGGRTLARNLDRLLGSHVMAGRRFLVGRGSRTNAAWTAFLARLTAAGNTPTGRAEIVESAVTTFSIFEGWLRGWGTLRQ